MAASRAHTMYYRPPHNEPGMRYAGASGSPPFTTSLTAILGQVRSLFEGSTTERLYPYLDTIRMPRWSTVLVIAMADHRRRISELSVPYFSICNGFD
ncbi:hypothetical protein PHLCEN_2v9278 [Hermanssonia centrifuga]|uniref:Uncharacterized protein n=1 Tax=Hermanssonia centrifuga TaxID=98765 RepID=A0A2R6NR71_9APHY|nr:hypothetical protein PHLCEN_2v9278 [Hermanssonia centrifuga]